MARFGKESPRQRIAAECSRRGTAAVVLGCVDLLQGREVDDALVRALGGPPAAQVLAGAAGGSDGYWPRVWACRGLLYAWGGDATAAVIHATGDDAWRVREMAAKVIARHGVEDCLPAAAGLLDDPVARVQAAAERAVMALHRSTSSTARIQRGAQRRVRRGR